MNRRSIICLLLLMCLFASVSARAEGINAVMPANGTVITEGAALRSAPTRAVPKTVSLNYGAYLSVEEMLRNDEGDWLRVTCEAGGKRYEGYVLMDYVEVELFDADGNPVSLPVKLRVSATAQCVGYNHVGYNWVKVIYLDGEKLTGAKTIELRAGDSLEFCAEFTEYDTYPDEGRAKATKTLTQADVSTGFTVTLEVPVSENRGRYSGYTCYWTVTYRFTRVY